MPPRMRFEGFGFRALLVRAFIFGAHARARASGKSLGKPSGNLAFAPFAEASDLDRPDGLKGKCGQSCFAPVRGVAPCPTLCLPGETTGGGAFLYLASSLTAGLLGLSVPLLTIRMGLGRTTGSIEGSAGDVLSGLPLF